MSEMSLRLLSEGEIELLHQKTLDLLEKTGAKVLHSEALAKLKKATNNKSNIEALRVYGDAVVEWGDASQLGPQDFADYSGYGGEMDSTEADYLRPAVTAQFEAVADQFLGGGFLCLLG